MDSTEGKLAAQHDNRLFVSLNFYGSNSDRVGQLGPSRTGLMRAIQKSDSLSEAARARGFTYKQAWRMIRQINALYREPLIVQQRGRNGGTRLSPTGEEVLKLYEEAERCAFAAVSKYTKKLEALLPADEPHAAI